MTSSPEQKTNDTMSGLSGMPVPPKQQDSKDIFVDDAVAEREYCPFFTYSENLTAQQQKN